MNALRQGRQESGLNNSCLVHDPFAWFERHQFHVLMNSVFSLFVCFVAVCSEMTSLPLWWIRHYNLQTANKTKSNRTKPAQQLIAINATNVMPKRTHRNWKKKNSNRKYPNLDKMTLPYCICHQMIIVQLFNIWLKFLHFIVRLIAPQMCQLLITRWHGKLVILRQRRTLAFRIVYFLILTRSGKIYTFIDEHVAWEYPMIMGLRDVHDTKADANEDDGVDWRNAKNFILFAFFFISTFNELIRTKQCNFDERKWKFIYSMKIP